MELVNSKYYRGFTLPEILVSLSIIAIVAGITLPTFYALRNGYTSSGAETIISAALSSAKAMAAKEQKYAGIRFQCVPDPENPSLPGDQYIVFIIQDPSLSAYGFRAAKGVAPIKLPINQGVTDMYVKDMYTGTPNDKYITADADIATADQLWDATTFSIVFSPSGRLVAHNVHVWNADGKPLTDDTSTDMIFNTYTNVYGAIKNYTPANPPTYRGMFYQDGEIISPSTSSSLLQESSRKNFVVYDKRQFTKADKDGKALTQCLQQLTAGDNSQVLYINPYTGTIIENQSQKNATR